MGRDYYRGRLALVTGGSEGIGLAVARGLLARGAGVVLLARDTGKLERAAAGLGRAAAGGQVVDWVSADVAHYPALEAAVAEVEKRHGPPWFAIGCAGFARPGWFHEQPVETLRAMTEVNYLGGLHLARALAPSLLPRRGGHLVLTASIAGFIGLFGYAGYCGTKFALLGLAQALRKEWAPLGIRVSVLCPPNTDTPGLARENRDKPPEVLATEEKVKPLKPEQVAGSLLRALPRDPAIVIPGVDGKLAWLLSRYVPWIVERITRRRPA